MKVRAALAHAAWLAGSLPAWHRFRRALRRPEEAQQAILRRLLRENAETSYGRACGLSEIRTGEQFRARVPIMDYEALEPWITRVRHGESGVLTREPVTRLLPTSGSSGARKLIPFTAGLQREWNAAIGPWMVDLTRAWPTLPAGPSYWSVSPALPDPGEESAVPIGFEDDSAYLGGLRRRLVEATMAVPGALRLVADDEEWRYLTLLCLLRQPELRLISVWHPSFLTLLLEAIPARWEELLRDLERGGCTRAAAPPEVQTAPAQPRRARELRALSPAHPATLWPRLRVVSCWGDGPAALALAELRRRLPTVCFQPKGLLATEALVSIPWQGRHPAAVGSHLLEFEDERGQVHPVYDLQLGERYLVLVSTAGGLWRYRLGDLVEVESFVESTPSLCFLGRGGSVSDLCGEKLSEAFVSQALGRACAASGFAPPFALLAPEEAGEVWHYTLFHAGAAPALFLAALAQELEENPHYALCLRLGQLGPLQGLEVTAGAEEIYLREEIRKGRRKGDIKPAHLSRNADWRGIFGSG